MSDKLLVLTLEKLHTGARSVIKLEAKKFKWYKTRLTDKVVTRVCVAANETLQHLHYKRSLIECSKYNARYT